MVAPAAHSAVNSITILPASLQARQTGVVCPSSCRVARAHAAPAVRGRGLGYERVRPSLASSKFRDAGVRKAFPGCGAPARVRVGAARSSLVQKVTAKELDEILADDRTQPVVVDFYALWCGPCLVLAQLLDKLSVEYGDAVRFVKVDTDAEPEFAEEMEIRGLPTLVFVSPDSKKQAIRTEGLLPEKVIREIIEKELKVPTPVAAT